jgi:hypothetical protein
VRSASLVSLTRPPRANSGHSPTVSRTGQIDPELPLGSALRMRAKCKKADFGRWRRLRQQLVVQGHKRRKRGQRIVLDFSRVDTVRLRSAIPAAATAGARLGRTQPRRRPRALDEVEPPIDVAADDMERQRGGGLVKLSSCANHLSGRASHQRDTISAGATGASLAVVQMAIRSDPNSQTQPRRANISRWG